MEIRSAEITSVESEYDPELARAGTRWKEIDGDRDA